MPSKAKNQQRHAKRRALERYGLEITQEKYDQIVKLVQSGKSKFLFRQSHRVSHFLIEFEGKSMRVVYDKQRKTIVTFLPYSEVEDLTFKDFEDDNAL